MFYEKNEKNCIDFNACIACLRFCFCKGKKDKAETEETVVEKPETAEILTEPYDDSFAK